MQKYCIFGTNTTNLHLYFFGSLFVLTELLGKMCRENDVLSQNPRCFSLVLLVSDIKSFIFPYNKILTIN